MTGDDHTPDPFTNMYAGISAGPAKMVEAFFAPWAQMGRAMGQGTVAQMPGAHPGPAYMRNGPRSGTQAAGLGSAHGRAASSPRTHYLSRSYPGWRWRRGGTTGPARRPPGRRNWGTLPWRCGRWSWGLRVGPERESGAARRKARRDDSGAAPRLRPYPQTDLFLA